MSTGDSGPAARVSQTASGDTRNALRPAADDRWSGWLVFLVVAGPLLVAYLLTSTYSRPYNIDAFTNVLTAWEIAQDGSPYLDDHEQLADPIYTGNVGWVQAVGDTAISQYPPGAALHAVPFYAIWPEDAELATVSGGNRTAPPVDILIPPLAPAAIAASLVVAIAMGLIALSFRKLVPVPVALGGAYLVGLGTSAWSVAANQLWQHGPGMLWIPAGGLLAASNLWGSGGAYAMAILIRPHTALIAASTGILRSWSDRSLTPALKVGLTSAVGLLAVIVYNAVIFSSSSVSGGYSGGFTDQALDFDLVKYGRNVWGAMFDTTRGLLVWSPFLIPLLFGLRTAWKSAPAWVRGPAVGGALYLLLQLKANRFSGGSGFTTYRYPLEMLAAAAPLLVLSYWHWVRHQWLAHRIFIVGVLFAVFMQAWFAIGS